MTEARDTVRAAGYFAFLLCTNDARRIRLQFVTIYLFIYSALKLDERNVEQTLIGLGAQVANKNEVFHGIG